MRDALTEAPDLSLTEEQRSWCRDHLGEIVSTLGAPFVSLDRRQLFDQETRTWRSDGFEPVYDAAGDVVGHAGIPSTHIEDASGRIVGFEEDRYYPTWCRLLHRADQLADQVTAVVDQCEIDRLAGSVTNGADETWQVVDVKVSFVDATGATHGGGGVIHVDELAPGETRDWVGTPLSPGRDPGQATSDVFPPPDDVAVAGCDVLVVPMGD